MGGSAKTATTTQQVSIPPEVMARYRAVNTRAEQVAQQPFQAYSQDPSAFVAQMNPIQQAGIGQIAGAGGGYQPYYQAGAGLTMSGAQGVGPLTQEQIGYYQNPFTQAVVGSTLANLQQQQGQQLSQQQAEAIKAGAFGGDRAGIQRAQLMGQQGLATAQAISPLLAQGYQQGVQTAMGQQGIRAQDLQRQLAAGQQIAGLGTGLAQTGLAAGQALLGAGGAQQQTEQAGLSALYNQFLQERSYPFQVAQFLANIATGTGALSGSTTTTAQPVPFMSDERDKTNVKPLGGGLYAYDYKDDVEAAEREGRPMPPKRVGPMAQDIEERAPGLVEEVGGHKIVKGLAPESMGGAVVDLEPGEYRERFAAGGMPDYSANLMKLYSMFGGQGQGQGLAGPYGARRSYVPEANLNVRDIAFKADTRQVRPISTIMQEAMSGAQQASNVANLFNPDKSPLARGAQAGLGAVRGAYQSATRPAGPTIDETSLTAQGLSEPSQPYSLPGSRRAYGGLVGYAEGGEVDGPIGVYDTPGAGLDIPTEMRQPKQLEAATPPAAPRSVMGDILGLAKTAASIYSGMPMAHGGLVPRHGYQDGGAPDERDAIFERMLRRESGMRQTDERGRPITSPKGAIGIAQVMPGTAPEAARLAGVEFDENRYRTDADYNRALGRAYYDEQYRRFNDPIIAAAAYNAGPGATRRALARAEETGRPFTDFLPRETRNYIADVGGPRAMAYAPSEGGLAGAPAQRAIAQQTEGREVAPIDARQMAYAPSEGGLVTAPPQRIAGQQTEGRVAAPSESREQPSGLAAYLPNKFGTREQFKTPGEFFTSKQFVVPFLTGLGAMASSPSLFAGSAALQGLGAGAQAYSDLETREAALRRQEAETGKVEAETSGIRVFTRDGRLMFSTKDPATGQERVGFFDEYEDMVKKGVIPPLSTKDFQMVQQRQQELIRQGIIRPPGAPEAPRTPSLAPTTERPAGAAAEPVAAPAAGATPERPAEPAGAAPERREAPIPATSPVPFTPEDRSRIEEWRARSNRIGTQEMQDLKDIYTPQQQIAASTEQQLQKFDALAGSLMNLPETGLLTAGAANKYVAPALNLLFSGLNVIGIKPSAQQTISDIETARKEIGQMAAAAAAAGNQNAERALRDFQERLPGPEMTRQGIAQTLSAIRVEMQKQIDKNAYFEQAKRVAQDSGGPNPLKSGAYFDLHSRFDERTRRLYGDEKKQLEKMYTETATTRGPDGNPVPIKDDKGRPMTIANYLYRYGSRTPKEVRDVLADRYGRSTLRYFGL